MDTTLHTRGDFGADADQQPATFRLQNVDLQESSLCWSELGMFTAEQLDNLFMPQPTAGAYTHTHTHQAPLLIPNQAVLGCFLC